jgi:uncharacterized protein with GYD domain
MSLYVSLLNFTDQGIGKIRNSPERLDQVKAELREMGGSFRDFYLTMGQHDAVLVYEAPDDAISARFQLLLGAKGNVRSTTMKAFPEEAYRKIIASLG